MTDSLPEPVPPAWVECPDGRLVPFDPDRVSRSLFAATVRLGQPNAFLARELADGAVHFLAEAADRPTTTPEEIREVVARAVRELGHSALSHAYLQTALKPSAALDETCPLPPLTLPSPAAALAVHLQAFSLEEVFAPDVAAAHREGLLNLGGLAAPLRLAATVLTVPAGRRDFSISFLDTQTVTAELVALDGADHVCRDESAAARFLDQLLAVLAATGLRAVLNLNTPAPLEASHIAQGPLFGVPAPLSLAPAASADFLREAALASALAFAGQLRVDWHLSEFDFQPAAAPRLHALARGLGRPGLAIVFDRPSLPISLAEGLDRRHPALLLRVGLDLARLLDRLDAAARPGDFLSKLPTLARLALAAGCQQREVLRRHAADCPRLAEGFRLERARLMVEPHGLDSPRLRGRAHDAVERLAAVLGAEGCARGLECVLEAPLLVAESGSGPRRQLAEATKYGSGGSLTAVLALPDALAGDLAARVALLREAWHETGLIRLRTEASSPRQGPLGTLSGEASRDRR